MTLKQKAIFWAVVLIICAIPLFAVMVVGIFVMFLATLLVQLSGWVVDCSSTPFDKVRAMLDEAHL